MDAVQIAVVATVAVLAIGLATWYVFAHNAKLRAAAKADIAAASADIAKVEAAIKAASTAYESTLRAGVAAAPVATPVAPKA